MRRRDFLASAALSAVPLACRRKPEFPFSGELVGPDLPLGHWVRGGAFAEPKQFEPISVLVVGGGVAGLSAGWRLAGAGFEDFKVLELERDPGGTSRSGRNHVSPFPWAAHYLPVPDRGNHAVLRLLDECGVLEGFNAKGDPRFAEEATVRAPEERIFAFGQWWEGLYLRAGASAEDERQYHAFFAEVDRWAAFRDAQGRPAFSIPRSRCSDAPEARALDGLSMAAWLDARGLTSPRLRWLLDYACRDDYGSRLDTTSAWAGLFYFAARKQGPGEDSRPLLTWPQGNGFLVEHLRRACGERLHCGTLATAIRQEGNDLLVTAWDNLQQRRLGWRAKRVIFAGPQHAARHVIEGLEAARPASTRIHNAPWLVANLTLRARPAEPAFPLAWDNVLRDSEALGYVVATHQSLRDYGPSVWTWYRPFAGPDCEAERARLRAMDWAACARMVMADLRPAHPDLEGLVARLDVMRWGHAMVRPAPGLLWDPAFLALSQPFGGIHFAHTELSGVALFEEAQDHGIRAAEEVLSALGRPGGSWR
ncbi:FAD-dependent oxidoreductase [Geothrix sp. PMB-07]|uniref:FAD-dependent oxidoreductase n=1 Tax=Geothrix sp. PMB-07 TaxID=3068640 RepID=UPI0027429E03|nr:NAD(P)-binding protein [Geothrix sp. PMB-07]WLT30303.1 NAD(P)-binding protein [Geothrix sp. PMB-07]